MKKNLIFKSFAGITLLALGSCAAESSFDEGEGTLRIRMVVNSEVKRNAVADEQSLADKCIIYISDSKGLLHKYQGLQNLPEKLALRSGHYVGEAWTGDSVSASFDKKFYKAYQPFDITKGNMTNVVLNCKIANVVASVRPGESLKDKMFDYTVTISNSRGSLDFNEENVAAARGFYMMPNNDNTLKWSIRGKNADGEDFTKSGEVNNVKPAHEYILNLTYNPQMPGDTGGGFITVTINEEELLVEDNITINAAPVVEGVGFDAAEPVSGSHGTFSDKVLNIYACQGFSNLSFNIEKYADFGLPTGTFDLMRISDASAQNIRNAGFNWTLYNKTELDQQTMRVTLGAEMLNRLSNGDYDIVITATDLGGRTSVNTVRFNVSDAAVRPMEADPSEIRAHSATLHAELIKEEYTNPAIQYRRQGSTEWLTAAPRTSRYGQTVNAYITGLEAGTTYEYRAVADGYVNDQILTFTTESIFIIPNAGLELWTKNGKGAYIPGASATPDFWDSGNHGSITMGKNITSPATDIFHGGATSAKLASQFVGIGTIGKFAAGNLFAGTYDETVGTDGRLTFGRPFNGTHPIKLRGWANYRPATVQYDGGGLSKGDTDQGSMYVALATKQYHIFTKSGSEQSLFNSQDAGILAYGEIVWTDNFGDDGSLRQFEINIEPREGYYTQAPAYLIIVASASRYGDYFAGGASVLYLDDLELVYE